MNRMQTRMYTDFEQDEELNRSLQEPEIRTQTNMGEANGNKKYPNDPERKVFEAARSGEAVLLNEVLQEMNSSERTSALETKMDASLRFGVGEYEIFKVTPLMVAVKNGNLDCVKVLLKYKADTECRGGDDEDDDDDDDGCGVELDRSYCQYSCRGCTPLIVAATYGHLDVLSCLIANGADVNTCLKHHSISPLMKASLEGHMDAVSLLVECGANMNHQDKNGDTALHYAVHFDSAKVAHKLSSLGASQLYNSQGFTPLLSASNKCRISVVEGLIKVPQHTKEQRIDALELLGASVAACCEEIEAGFQYIKRGMEERFADPSHPLLKQPMEPVEAYQNRKESQTLEELAQIEHDRNSIIMEGLMIKERIFGKNSVELLGAVRSVASYYEMNHIHSICKGLYMHAMKIAQQCNQSGVSDLHELTSSLSYNGMQIDVFPREEVFLELLEQAIIEYEQQQKLRRLNRLQSKLLFDSTMELVLATTKLKYCKEGETSCVLLLLKRLCCLNPRDEHGDTLLHKALKSRLKLRWTDADNLCGNLDTVKLLLNAGLSVNAINNNGDTSFHRAVTYKPGNDNVHLLTDLLEVLLVGGAHHDFVNNDGKTAMDLAKTDEARRILSKKRKLELECISARAVKKFGLPYLGVVPKILEKYISMH